MEASQVKVAWESEVVSVQPRSEGEGIVENAAKAA